MALVAILAFFCMLSAFITFGLGMYVYARNPASPVNRLFVIVMLSATYWAIGEFLIWQSVEYENVWLWLKFSSFWPFVIAFTAHFVLLFCGHPLSTYRRPYLVASLLYFSAAMISLVGLFSENIYTVRYVGDVGYTYIPAGGSLSYVAESTYSLVLMLWILYVAVTSWRAATVEKVRRQNFLVSAGLLTIIACGMLSGIILPSYGIYTPNLVFIGIVVFTVLITYAVLTCGLFTLSPETALPDLLRTMPDGMVLLDPLGRIIAANPAAAGIFAKQEEDLRGMEAASLIPKDEYDTLMVTIRERGCVSDFEATVGEGPSREVSIAGALVKDPSGNPAGCVLVIRDITSRKAAEMALRIANKKISLLTTLTRHDISNLVTALSAYLELMRDGANEPMHDAYLASSIQITEKIAGHLRFSRDYQDFGSNQPAWQDLRLMVSRAIEDVPCEGIGVMSNVGPVEIYADPLTTRVISNLLDNAIRHGEGVSSIRIWTEEGDDGDLVIVFEDDGTGISEKEKEQIFRYGYGKHTGLGLAISRDILSITGITIRETGKSGEGARFEIHVPPRAWRVIE
ncbi:MAG TPA: ATP-binding protein [Methanolinea sp.]|nr:ATP-binding protein [Methanolinea sp.]